MEVMDYLLAAALGIALAAATGFRVFLPWLAVALAARFGWYDLAPAFAWMVAWPVIAMLAVATLAEIAAYYVPGIDHTLDALAAPLALVAGTLVMAVPLWDLPPVLKWSAAIIAGGGAAGLTHTLGALVRAKSAVATGGLANPLVASGESGGALLLVVLALALPLLALAAVLVCVVLAVRAWRRPSRAAGARPAARG